MSHQRYDMPLKVRCQYCGYDSYASQMFTNICGHSVCLLCYQTKAKPQGRCPYRDCLYTLSQSAIEKFEVRIGLRIPPQQYNRISSTADRSYGQIYQEIQSQPKCGNCFKTVEAKDLYYFDQEKKNSICRRCTTLRKTKANRMVEHSYQKFKISDAILHFFPELNRPGCSKCGDTGQCYQLETCLHKYCLDCVQSLQYKCQLADCDGQVIQRNIDQFLEGVLKEKFKDNLVELEEICANCTAINNVSDYGKIEFYKCHSCGTYNCVEHICDIKKCYCRCYICLGKYGRYQLGDIIAECTYCKRYICTKCDQRIYSTIGHIQEAVLSHECMINYQLEWALKESREISSNKSITKVEGKALCDKQETNFSSSPPKQRIPSNQSEEYKTPEKYTSKQKKQFQPSGKLEQSIKQAFDVIDKHRSEQSTKHATPSSDEKKSSRTLPEEVSINDLSQHTAIEQVVEVQEYEDDFQQPELNLDDQQAFNMNTAEGYNQQFLQPEIYPIYCVAQCEGRCNCQEQFCTVCLYSLEKVNRIELEKCKRHFQCLKCSLSRHEGNCFFCSGIRPKLTKSTPKPLTIRKAWEMEQSYIDTPKVSESISKGMRNYTPSQKPISNYGRLNSYAGGYSPAGGYNPAGGYSPAGGYNPTGGYTPAPFNSNVPFNYVPNGGLTSNYHRSIERTPYTYTRNTPIPSLREQKDRYLDIKTPHNLHI